MNEATAFVAAGGSNGDYGGIWDASVIGASPERPYEGTLSLPAGTTETVSYTHLDVYKRQITNSNIQ